MWDMRVRGSREGERWDGRAEMREMGVGSERDEGRSVGGGEGKGQRNSGTGSLRHASSHKSRRGRRAVSFQERTACYISKVDF